MGLLGRLFRFLFGPAKPPISQAPERRVVDSPRERLGPRPSPQTPVPAQDQVISPPAEAERTLPPSSPVTPPVEQPGPVVPQAAQDPYFSTTAEKPKPAPTSNIGLDASDYLPISRSEIKAAARGKDLLANVWFGRRDLIPPPDDERTRLIDRALVTQGLLTPEQLVEIHQAGLEHDRVQSMLNAINTAAERRGDAAVIADREARDLIKAQKKAEAAERDQQRAEAIAHRRATDIVFLGRGVSGRLGDRQSNVEALTSAGLPLLSTPAELAEALSLQIPRLRWLAFHTEVATRIHYVQFTVPKRSGGTRMLSAPHRSLAAAQRWILHEILAKLPVESSAHGFIAGRSILSNATPHAKQAIVVNTDLENFFPSVGFPRVRRLFQTVGYSPAVATILALLCTECPRKLVHYEGKPYYVATGPRGLPQGACTSPALSNQVAKRLDRRLRGLSDRLGLTYTRYADDLTFSGDPALESKIGYLMARIRHISQDEGFRVNESKTRILGRHTAQTVTGLVVNDRPGVPRAEIRQIRAILHRARTEGLSSQNRDGRPNYLAWLQGKIAYITMSRPEVGQRFREQLAALLQDRDTSNSP